VARQYCGQLGKRDNCQIAVSLSLANHAASLPIAWRLYLPVEWTADSERRAVAGIPETIRFLTKPEIWSRSRRLAPPVCRAGLC
jgi:SRSO17 transposase